MLGLKYRPTDSHVVDGVLLVADGYGSSFVHEVDKDTGAYLGKTYGGIGRAGNTNGEHVRFDCNHGMNYDKSRNLVVFTDRANSRLVYTKPNGDFHSEVALESVPGMEMPCNVDVQGDYAVAASLGTLDGMNDGSVGIVDQRTGNIVSVLEIAALLGHEGHKHPHDAIFLPNGDIAVCTWNPGRLSYWRRLQPSKM